MRLRKSVILVFFLSLSVFGLNGPGEKPAGIIVESDLPPRYKSGLVDTATAAAQAYFTHLDEYFQLKQAEPPKVYLSLTLADAESLIKSHGLGAEAGKDFYVPSVNAAYAYLKEDAGDKISWDGLFEPIAEYYVHQRFSTAPLWFKYGLTTSISKNTRINDNELVLSGPCPEESLILLEEDKKGERLIVKKLFQIKDDTFRKSDEITEQGEQSWKIGKPFARLLFCWLYKTGKLKQYIIDAHNNSCGLAILLKSIKEESHATVNRELTNFLRNDCKALAILAKAEQTANLEQKEALLTEAINLVPDCWQARVALARLYYKSDRKSDCTRTLEPLLIRDDKISYFTVAKIEAACLYDDGDYAQALEYYQKLWEKSEFYPYKYQIAYKIANCNHYLNQPEEAAKWYAEFLNLDWSSNDDTKAIQYAKKYCETFGESKSADVSTY